MKKIIFILLVFFISMSTLSAKESHKKRVILIKTMTLDIIEERTKAFIAQMEKEGFTQGKNLDLVVLNAEKNLELGIKKLRAEVAKKRPDLIVSIATIASQATKEVIKETSIPMLFFFVADPVGAGITKDVKGFTGTNITGLIHTTDREKKIKLAREFLDTKHEDKMINIAFIYSTYPSSVGELREIIKVYKNIKNINFVPIKIEQLAMDKRDIMIEAILKELNEKSKSKEIDYGWFSTGPLDLDEKIVKSIIEKSPIPILLTNNDSGPKNGAYISIEADPIRDGIEVAKISKEILLGKSPKDIELRASTYFKFCANLKTTLKDGLIIPPNLLKLISKDCLYK